MATTKRKPKPTAPPAYRGAETCGFVWERRDADPTLLALIAGCDEADPDDLAPPLVLADWLADHGDPRETWVRVACDLWAACRTIRPAGEVWRYEKVRAALTPVCMTAAGWRLSCLWGCLLAWHAPTATGEPMGRTWADARVPAVWRGVWWWSLGFAATNPAEAAAWYQAYAAGYQAYAAWYQAYAAWYQAYAAGYQAYAAWYQADAAGSQVEAARRQVWQFARASWELCAAKLPVLESAT